MSYSKLAQEKTYMITIDYHRVKCPICNRKGQYHENIDTGDYECECGHIIHTVHNYTAGQRINTDLNYKTTRRYKNGNTQQK